jgi:hypothetical protein
MFLNMTWRAVKAISNLAVTYRALKRYTDAVGLDESVLAHSRSMLPENHPDIGKRHAWSDAMHAI